MTIHDAAEAIAAAARAGDGRVLLPGGAMEALALEEAFGSRPDLAAGLLFCGLPVPGVNRFDWAGLHPQAQMTVCMPMASEAAERTRLLAIHYSAFFQALTASPAAVQVLHLTRPDATGSYTQGFSADIPAGLGQLTIGLVNAALPPVVGAPRIAAEQLDILVEVDHAPVLVPGASSGGPEALVAHVAGLVPDGATIQTGIGRLPGAILAGLTAHQRLNVHSGLIGPELLALLDSGTIGETGTIRTGLVLGDGAFLERMAEEPRLKLVPVPVTHGHASLSAIPALISINAALEADLAGQINCEWAGSRRVASVGGAVDFLRGARASRGGLAITMIQASGKDGTSRIVRQLDCPTVSISRADADVIVTEHGIARLRTLPDAERTAAMAALAPPEVRAGLLDGGTA